jgi:hypothetical protein
VVKVEKFEDRESAPGLLPRLKLEYRKGRRTKLVRPYRINIYPGSETRTDPEKKKDSAGILSKRCQFNGDHENGV